MGIRINIVGASGSGTTTVGKLLATKLSCRQLEADDYLWLPKDPPYQKTRSDSEKYEIAFESLSNHTAFVLSGCIECNHSNQSLSPTRQQQNASLIVMPTAGLQSFRDDLHSTVCKLS